MGSRPAGRGPSLVANELRPTAGGAFATYWTAISRASCASRVQLTGSDAAAMCRPPGRPSTRYSSTRPARASATYSARPRPIRRRRARGRGGTGRVEPREDPRPGRAAVGPPVLGPHHAQERPLPRLLDLRPVARGERRRRQRGPRPSIATRMEGFPCASTSPYTKDRRDWPGRRRPSTGFGHAGQKRRRRSDVCLQDLERRLMERLYPGNLEESRPNPI